MNKLLIFLLALCVTSLEAATITNWGTQLPTMVPASGDAILMQKGGVTYYFTPVQLATFISTNLSLGTSNAIPNLNGSGTNATFAATIGVATNLWQLLGTNGLPLVFVNSNQVMTVSNTLIVSARPQSTTTVPLTIAGSQGQDANLFNVKDYLGNVLFAISYDGTFSDPRLASPSSAGALWTATDDIGNGAWSTNLTPQNLSISNVIALKALVLNANKQVTNAATSSADLDNFFAMGITSIVASTGIGIGTNGGVLVITNTGATTVSNAVIANLNGKGTNTTFYGIVTGATVRATNLYDSSNVKFWGAVGDGIANDTAAFDAAIAFVITNNQELIVPAGTFLANIKVPALIEVPSPFGGGGFTMRGEGSALTTIKPFSLASPAITISNTYGGTLSGLSIVSPTDNTGVGLKLGDTNTTGVVRYYEVRDVLINGFDIGIQVDGFSRSELNNIRVQSGRIGLLDNSMYGKSWFYGGVISGSYFGFNTNALVLTGGSFSSLTIYDCDFESNERQAIILAPTGVDTSAASLRVLNSRFEANNLSDTGLAYCIEVQTPQSGAPLNAVFDNNVFGPFISAHVPILLNSAGRYTVENSELFPLTSSLVRVANTNIVLQTDAANTKIFRDGVTPIILAPSWATTSNGVVYLNGVGVTNTALTVSNSGAVVAIVGKSSGGIAQGYTNDYSMLLLDGTEVVRWDNNVSGLRVKGPSTVNDGVIRKAVGVWTTAGTNDSSNVPSYGLYAEGNGANSYAAVFMGGNVGFGTPTPSSSIDVTGQVRSASAIFTNSVTVVGTTNQLIFSNTNPAPASAVSPTKWISVQITGDATLYRLPLYQ